MAEIGVQQPDEFAGDEVLLLHLAAGKSVRTAARLANVSERTAFRRLEDVAFKARIQEIRASMMGRASGKLASGAVSAAAALIRLLRSQNEAIVCQSARALLDLNNKLRDSIIFDERLRALESRAKG